MINSTRGLPIAVVCTMFLWIQSVCACWQCAWLCGTQCRNIRAAYQWLKDSFVFLELHQTVY
ncbi:hypothetical protein KC19_7G015600 [Ceratodon purpureus]|uniref:Secreted protein n=1 Tax=Ceratodon purpureus TaxID=3225 RepID=A0A8T0H6N3_CERPU|nr:hypothetical protein KC19_7G015600 [Ceratodon purpureus]